MSIRFIDRDGSLNITGDYAREQQEGQESILESDADFIAYKNPPTSWTDVAILQVELLSATSGVAWRIARYQSQKELTGQSTTETATKYQELLQHCQDVRDSDETTYATPQEALDALELLTIPAQV